MVNKAFDGVCTHVRRAKELTDDWKPITDRCYSGDTPWELRKFDRIVEFQGCLYHVLVIDRVFFDPANDEYDFSEEIFCQVWYV